jgi:glycine dehydrogenase subunit 2
MTGGTWPIGPKPPPRRFHQARWDEPVIFELSQPGARGVLPPVVEPEIREVVGDPVAALPAPVRRANPPALPELPQLHVVRHYARLSQENLGVDLNVDVGQGTCTMKYSPKVNDQLARNPKVAELHPLQDPSTTQGILEIMWRLEQMLTAISGLDRVTLQPGAGSAAIYTNVSMIRAYHASRGEGARDQVITTIFSHPSNAACAKTAGYEVITLYPDADGYPDLGALRTVVSERTAALLITNPEDTGIFNPRIDDFVRVVHEAGGLCAYDQANANGILGITRAREAGFDLCHFNLHKTFSTPHACGGPAAGACAVTEELAPFLPVPTVERDSDGTFRLDHDRPMSIGKIRPWYGVVPNIVRAYAWIMSLGAEGLREVAETAVLNNNYLMHKVLEIAGVSAPYAEGRRRIEQVRYSWEELARETGVRSEDLGLRAADFGTHYWTSHHPWVVPEPMTLEPTESYSKADLDEYAAILAHVAEEARTDPELVKTAPHASTVHRDDHEPLDDPERWAVTWRAYRRKAGLDG